MPSIDDITPAAATETVPIRRVGDDGQERVFDIEVRGMSIREWAAVVKRFPNVEPVGDALVTAPTEGEAEPVTAAAIVARAERMVEGIDVACAVIAIGLNSPGDKSVEEKIEARFSEAEIEQLFDAVIRLTRPPSTGPLARAADGQAPARGSESPGKVGDGALSSRSTPSSGSGTSAPM